MSLLTTSNLSKSYGAVDIFTDISVSIPRWARIAIVGPNGIGKTTLLRSIIGLEEPSEGRIIKAKDIKIGYLPQEAGLSGPNTLWEECLHVLSELLSMEEKLADLEAAMADPIRADEALEHYGILQQEFEQRGGYVYETRIRSTLTGLGFNEIDFHRPLTQLSGGQRTRAFLARLLLSDPDLLVLDEPTNHLDIAAVEWLEGYLSNWEGAVLIVSHDRYFLDKVVDHIWEMVERGMEIYRGNYSAYTQQRQDRWELRKKVAGAEIARLEKELDYVKRNIAAQNTLQAKGKLKRLSREVQAIESLGFEAVQKKKWLEISGLVDISHTMSVAEVEQRIRRLNVPRNRPPRLNIKLSPDLRSGDLVLRTYDLEIGYTDEGRPLFKAPDLLLKRGDCAAIIGPNGAGKTTFLKTLLQHMPPLKGSVKLGASLRIGFFAQAHEDLNPEFSMVEEIEAVAPRMLIGDIRNYLAKYSFTREDVFKKVATLSGGERGRLALAKLSLSNANLLLLDEPTNHLDIPSQEILQEVLMSYGGTIMLVSHDRYLIDALGTQIWEIEPDERSMHIFSGTYSEYRAVKAAEHTLLDTKLRKKHQSKKRKNSIAASNERKRRARILEIEERVKHLERIVELLSVKLENPPQDPAEVQKLGQTYVQAQDEIDSLLKEWDDLQSSEVMLENR